MFSIALFVQGLDKAGDNFKWLAEASKAERLQYINLLAMALVDMQLLFLNEVEQPGQAQRYLYRNRVSQNHG